MNQPTKANASKIKKHLTQAENILAIKKAENLPRKYGMVNPHKGKIRLLDYFETIKEKRSGYLANYGVWVSTKRDLVEFFHSLLTFNELTMELIEQFKTYLDLRATTKYGTPLKHGSKYSYFNRFRSVVKTAYEEGFLTDPRFLKVKSFDEKEGEREFLTLEEVQKLAGTECKYQILKRAFLFSCLTGLRWSDIYKLKWSEVRDENNKNKIVFTQKKTDNIEYLYINPQARELLGERSKTSDRVFVGLEYGAAITTELLRWCMKAGITKHITFHLAGTPQRPYCWITVRISTLL